jgi:hypothetical protein
VSPIFILLCVVLLVAQLALPRRYAFAPLLIAIFQFQNVPIIEVGGGFSVTKLVILVGLFRAARERTLVWSGGQRLDLWVAVWAAWMILSGFAHDPKDHNPITIRLSQVYNVFGAYLYARSFIRSHEDFTNCCKCLVLALLPLAFETVLEKTLVRNYYVILAGAGEGLGIRGGKVRAAGPFGHPILLGCAAATSIPLCAVLWLRARRWAIAGAAACALIVFCSASSGPMVTMLSGFMALALWRFRESVGWIRRLIIFLVVLLHLVMQAPVWYLMGRIDLAGGSTGFHRAELIQQAVNHFGDWWLTGTDYTRHWFPYGVGWSKYHTDITNQYIAMGVSGGLLLMILFIMMPMKGFQLLGGAMRRLRKSRDPSEFLLWCLGCCLFTHCFTFLSIAYFDQCILLFAVLLGVIPGATALMSAPQPGSVSNVGLESPTFPNKL